MENYNRAPPSGPFLFLNNQYFQIKQVPMSLFRNKYRIESSRLPRWDYSSPGYYFVTICTWDRGCLFGEILDNEMRLNAYGRIVLDEWNKTGIQRSNIRLDDFIVMPNHIHGIIRILSTNDYRCRSNRRDVARNVSTINAMKNTPPHGENDQIKTMSTISPKSGSLSEIVRSFKSAATKRINGFRKSPGIPVWQPRFYDHIIRNVRELFAIRQYIRNNPANWAHDRNVIESEEIKPAKQPWFVYLP
jgi:putative transposase